MEDVYAFLEYLGSYAEFLSQLPYYIKGIVVLCAITLIVALYVASRVNQCLGKISSLMGSLSILQQRSSYLENQIAKLSLEVKRKSE